MIFEWVEYASVRVRWDWGYIMGEGDEALDVLEGFGYGDLVGAVVRDF